MFLADRLSIHRRNKFGVKMKLIKKIAPAFIALSVLAGSLYADPDDLGDISQHDQELEERDWDALAQYLQSLRERKYKEVRGESGQGRDGQEDRLRDTGDDEDEEESEEDKEGDEEEDKEEDEPILLLSGDVRMDWRRKTETLNGHQLFGPHAIDSRGRRRGRNKFDVEFNLRLDYIQKWNWATIQLQFDNSAGVDDDIECRKNTVNFFSGEPILVCQKNELFGSGSCLDICLKRAYFGFRLYDECDTTIDIEIGRRNLYQVFDSKVEFLSRFDGILFKYDTSFDWVGEYYVHAAAFVVDFRADHYAWVIETGLLDIRKTGIDLKYSLIDWRKNGRNRCFRRHPLGTEFVISQVVGYYHMKPSCLNFNLPTVLFAAALVNQDAEPLPKFGLDSKQNFAWYAGVRLGEVRNKGDYAIGIMYQWVEAQSVPDPDMSGIGTGNVLDQYFYSEGAGNTNFKGWRIEGLYAFSDNISVDTRVQWSSRIKKFAFNPWNHSYSEFKTEIIYAF